MSREHPVANQLAAIAYPDLATAERARDELIQVTREGRAHLEDAVVVERALDGEVKLHQFKSGAARGTAVGAASGALIGLLFLAPLLGMAVGAATGGLGAKLSDRGVDDLFMTDLGARLRPGAAALIVLGTAESRDEIIERVKPYGGEVVHTSLSRADEQRLRDALADGATTARSTPDGAAEKPS
jgi:uncharacterized membrane protein